MHTVWEWRATPNCYKDPRTDTKGWKWREIDELPWEDCDFEEQDTFLKK